MANQVVARFADGRLVKGSSLDVDLNRPQFHVRGDDGAMTQVQLSDLKALFFVKSMDGDAARVDAQDITPVDPRLRGSRVMEVTFHDDETIVGLSTRYPPNRPYFFLVPVDAASNNLRILINAQQVKSMSLVETSGG